MNPEISVVIPVYNGASFVGRAIDSALDQTYPPREVLVVDDGSSDDTAKVVSRFPAPVRLLRQANAGPAAARNHGAREVGGSWIGFLDADDAWLPDKLAAQAALTGDDAVGIVNCCTQIHAIPSPVLAITFESLWRRNRITTSTTLVRREAFRQAGGFDEDRELISVEDYNLWLRMTAAGWRVAMVAEALCLYTPTPNSLTAQISRFARAELANVEKIGRVLHLPPETLRNKIAAVHEQYGREFLHAREMTAARDFLWRALVEKPSLSSIAWAAAAHLPRSVLDLRRQLRHCSPRGKSQLGVQV